MWGSDKYIYIYVFQSIFINTTKYLKIFYFQEGQLNTLKYLGKIIAV